MKQRRIAVINQKGGVGKTTCTANIGAGLSRLGRQALLIDLDPQAHLTASLGIDPGEPRPSVYDLLAGRASLGDALLTIDGGFSLLPSTMALSDFDAELAGQPDRHQRLQQAMAGCGRFQYILIDCPPSLGLLTVNALVAASDVYIPIQPEFLALQGLSSLGVVIALVQERLNATPKVSGAVITRYDQRKLLNREVSKKIQEHYGPVLFNTYIRDNISLAEAPSFGQTIFQYRPDSNGARDYTGLCQEIIGRVETGQTQ